ncbi:MAG TPA: hypothetical protein PLQ67_05670, partial [Burkholderiaceae bacterium]|nr:hypothetical protein [Burkholderiaceae bacterium]
GKRRTQATWGLDTGISQPITQTNVVARRSFGAARVTQNWIDAPPLFLYGPALQRIFVSVRSIAPTGPRSIKKSHAFFNCYGRHPNDNYTQ